MLGETTFDLVGFLLDQPGVFLALDIVGGEQVVEHGGDDVFPVGAEREPGVMRSVAATTSPRAEPPYAACRGFAGSRTRTTGRSSRTTWSRGRPRSKRAGVLLAQECFERAGRVAGNAVDDVGDPVLGASADLVVHRREDLGEGGRHTGVLQR